jgi:glycosyltransferase involved in cell wall biosynthesis
MSSIKNIIFYFPHKKIGGVSTLFLNASEILQKKFDIHIVDFNDGYMKNNLPNGVNFIDVENIDKYPIDSIVIFQSFRFWNIRDFEKFDSRTKIIFWNLHPDNLYPYIFSNKSTSFKSIIANLIKPLSFFRQKKIGNLITYLNKNGGIFFMDEENYLKTCSYFKTININENYLPVITKKNILVKKSNSDLNNFAWIGRICDFKVHILIHLLQRLNTIYALNYKKLNFYIVGDGEEMPLLKKEVLTLKNLNIEFLGEVDKDMENKIFSKNIDILFAMGMSALEGASRSIPTVLLDYSYKKIKNKYRFNLAFNSKKYTLAKEIKASNFEKVCTLNNLLMTIKNDYLSISNKSYLWWLHNYSGESFEKKINNIFKKNSTSFEDLKDQKFNKVDLISFYLKNISKKLISEPKYESHFNQY